MGNGLTNTSSRCLGPRWQGGLVIRLRFTEDSIREYLVMLSVAETCGYQNIDVLKFLLDRADNSSAGRLLLQ
jgi:hypothetical protein